MKARSAKPFICLSTAVLCLLTFGMTSAANAAEESWTRVRSANFTLAGNADEQLLRKVALQLEQYREAFSRVLSPDYFDSTTPTTVLVLRDDGTLKPQRIAQGGQPADVAGYFLAGADVDYITIFIAPGLERELSALVLHEYVHLLVKNNFRGAPLWFKEGLAEYYSTAQVSADQRSIRLGSRIKSSVLALRETQPLPLETLLKVDFYSPYYNEHEKRILFYAESWALVHYLLSDRTSLRGRALAHYLNALAGGATVEESFRQAFQTEFAALDEALRRYIRGGRYTEQVKPFREPLRFNAGLEVSLISPAEGEAYIGDLMLHSERFQEAEQYLQRAIESDSNLARPRISLGILYIQQNRFTEAKEHLERALALSPDSYLAHYYHAQAVYLEGPESDTTVSGYLEMTRRLREELKRAIELAPDFLEAYKLLATIEIKRGGQLDEAVALLKRAIERAPKRQEVLLFLADVYMRKREFGTARQLLLPLAQQGSDRHLRTQAQALLTTLAAKEEAAAHPEAQPDQTDYNAWIATTPCDMTQPGPQVKRLRFQGQQVCGELVSVECSTDGVTLFVDTGVRMWKLHSDGLNRIRFVTYTTDVKGLMTCGLRQPANPVLVTYREVMDDRAVADGKVIAVEFVPVDWKH